MNWTARRSGAGENEPSGQSCAEHADHVFAHRFADPIFGRTRFDRCVGQGGQFRCVKGGSDRPVKVRAQRHVIFPHHIDGGQDRAGDASRFNAAACHFGPVSHTDRAARRRNVLHRIVRKVAFDAAIRGNAWMADDRRGVGDGQNVSGHCRAGMGEVDDHAPRDGFGDDRALEFGEAAVRWTLEGSAQTVVKEMLKADDPVTGGIEACRGFRF